MRFASGIVHCRFWMRHSCSSSFFFSCNFFFCNFPPSPSSSSSILLLPLPAVAKLPPTHLTLAAVPITQSFSRLSLSARLSLSLFLSVSLDFFFLLRLHLTNISYCLLLLPARTASFFPPCFSSINTKFSLVSRQTAESLKLFHISSFFSLPPFFSQSATLHVSLSPCYQEFCVALV